MLPMDLAGGGSFTASTMSRHALTNAELIARFLPVEIRLERRERYSICCVQTSCAPG